MFDVALLLVTQPRPAGGRVAVVGNSAALEVLVANGCRAEGLEFVWGHDVGVGASAEVYDASLREAIDDPDVDAVIVTYAPTLPAHAGEQVAEVLRRLAPGAGKPILSTFLGLDGVPEQLAAVGHTHPPQGSVPSFRSPERAVRALACAVRYAAWCAEPAGSSARPRGVDPAAARAVASAALAGDPAGRELRPDEVSALLAGVGLSVSAEIPVGAVDVVLTAREHPALGALLSFGVAGVATDLLGDRAFALVPLTDQDAERLVLAPRAAPLLTGYAGAAPADLVALHDVVLRLSALADAVPEVAECALRVLAAPVGAYLAEAEIRVAPSRGRADTGPRRLVGL